MKPTDISNFALQRSARTTETTRTYYMKRGSVVASNRFNISYYTKKLNMQVISA